MIWQQINLNKNVRMVLRHHRNKVIAVLRSLVFSPDWVHAVWSPEIDEDWAP